MSAFLCSPEHIGVMVKALEQAYEQRGHEFDRMGSVGALARSNWDSIAYLYGTDRREIFSPWGGLEVYSRACLEELPTAMPPLSPVRLYGIVSCYIYQACEPPDWEESRAYRLCQELKDYILARLVEASGEDMGWSYREEEGQ